ncbi:hypothetical protein JW998_04890 [candidate division KSB1 bacterium]|nr:hypothetical protein [candidate division KSB1 bacterium]
MFFLAKVALFLLLLLTLDYAVGSVVEGMYKRSPWGPNWTKENWLLDQQPDFIVFGSSRSLRHYVPSIIAEELELSIFNAGQNGQYLLYSYALEQLVLEHYTPKVIVLDILPSFIIKLENPREEFERLSALSPFIYNSAVRQLLTRQEFFEGLKYQSKMFRFNSRILSIMDNFFARRITVDNGYEIVGDLRYHDRNPFIVDVLKTIEIDSFKLNLFRQFFSTAQEKGVAAFAVFSPVSEPVSAPVQQTLAIYRTLFRELNVPFLDFSADIYAKDLFSDLIHLDGEGAAVFSREFARRFAQLSKDAYNQGKACRSLKQTL